MEICCRLQNINSFMEAYEKWPLPVIKEILSRLSDNIQSLWPYGPDFRKLSSSESPRQHCFESIHNLLGRLRVALISYGLQEAPSYFQKVMPSNILLNLVAIICEVYLDDVVVHGQAEAEYLDNLKQVFDRLRKYIQRDSATPVKS